MLYLKALVPKVQISTLKNEKTKHLERSIKNCNGLGDFKRDGE